MLIHVTDVQLPAVSLHADPWLDPGAFAKCTNMVRQADVSFCIMPVYSFHDPHWVVWDGRGIIGKVLTRGFSNAITAVRLAMTQAAHCVQRCSLYVLQSKATGRAALGQDT